MATRNQWTGTSILKWACIKLWPAARSALNQSSSGGSSLRADLKIDSVDSGLLVRRLDSRMQSTGGKGRTGLDLPESEGQRRDADRDGMPSPRPAARNVSVIGKQAAHRDVVLWGKGPVKSDASSPAVAWPVEIGENCEAPGIPHDEIRGACVC